VFALLRKAQLSGKEIGKFYEMCHSHPVKALGVLYAKEQFGLYRNYPLKGQVAAYRTPNAQLFQVNNMVDQAEWAIGSAKALAMIQANPQEKSKNPSTYKFDDLVADARGGNWEEIQSQARAGNVRVSVEPINPERRFDGKKGYVMSMTRMADGDPAITNMLMGIVAASQKVDPTNLDAYSAPLKALDEAGIYGKDIEGLYQICGRHPGKVVALLRATTLGLVDAPAIKAALKPVGILRAGGLDVDGITKKVESSVPEFSVSRVEMDTLTGPKAPNLHAALDQVVREAPTPPKDLGRGSK
jgi:hypothetical protein